MNSTTIQPQKEKSYYELLVENNKLQAEYEYWFDTARNLDKIRHKVFAEKEELQKEYEKLEAEKWKLHHNVHNLKEHIIGLEEKIEIYKNVFSNIRQLLVGAQWYKADSVRVEDIKEVFKEMV